MHLVEPKPLTEQDDHSSPSLGMPSDVISDQNKWIKEGSLEQCKRVCACAHMI